MHSRSPNLGVADLGSAGQRNDYRPGADILACIAYGAEMSRERFADIPVKKTA